MDETSEVILVSILFPERSNLRLFNAACISGEKLIFGAQPMMRTSFGIKIGIVASLFILASCNSNTYDQYKNTCIENVKLQFSTTSKRKIESKHLKRIKGHCKCLSRQLNKIYDDTNMSLLIESRIEYTAALHSFEEGKPHPRGTKKPITSFPRFARKINDPQTYRKHEEAVYVCKRYGLHSS